MKFGSVIIGRVARAAAAANIKTIRFLLSVVKVLR